MINNRFYLIKVTLVLEVTNSIILMLILTFENLDKFVRFFEFFNFQNLNNFSIVLPDVFLFITLLFLVIFINISKFFKSLLTVFSIKISRLAILLKL